MQIKFCSCLKKTIVQIKFCVRCPCLFRGTSLHVLLNYYCVGNLIHVQRRKNGAKDVEGTLRRTLGRSSKQRATYVPTIRKMVFSDYTKYRILLLRRRGNRALGISRLRQNKCISTSRRVFSKLLLKYKQSGTIAIQKTRAWSSSLHDTQDLSFIVFCRDIL